MKRKDAKEHSTAYKVGGLGLETLWRVSKNFPTELSVKYSTVHVLLNHIHIRYLTSDENRRYMFRFCIRHVRNHKNQRSCRKLCIHEGTTTKQLLSLVT